jgi:hypothetical protein
MAPQKTSDDLVESFFEKISAATGMTPDALDSAADDATCARIMTTARTFVLEMALTKAKVANLGPNRTALTNYSALLSTEVSKLKDVRPITQQKLAEIAQEVVTEQGIAPSAPRHVDPSGRFRPSRN